MNSLCAPSRTVASWRTLLCPRSHPPPPAVLCCPQCLQACAASPAGQQGTAHPSHSLTASQSCMHWVCCGCSCDPCNCVDLTHTSWPPQERTWATCSACQLDVLFRARADQVAQMYGIINCHALDIAETPHILTALHVCAWFMQRQQGNTVPQMSCWLVPSWHCQPPPCEWQSRPRFSE